MCGIGLHTGGEIGTVSAPALASLALNQARYSPPRGFPAVSVAAARARAFAATARNS